MSIYKELLGHYMPVLEERELERMFVGMFSKFQGASEVLEQANIYESVRGFPLVLDRFEYAQSDDAQEKITAARARANHIVVMVTDPKEQNGHGSATLKVMIARDYHGTVKAAVQVAAVHEQWCAAIRGIMSPAAQCSEYTSTLELANFGNTFLELTGWQSTGEISDEFDGTMWVHTESFTLNFYVNNR